MAGTCETTSSGPKALYLEITDRCNMACPMCITRHHRADELQKNTLDLEQIRDRILGPGRDLGLKTLVVSGGEPLMSPLFQDTLRTAKRMGYRLYLATNLYRVEPGLLEWLVREMDSPTHTLQFSFDSMDPFQMNRIRGGNVYDQVLSNVRKLMDLRRSMGSGLRFAASLVMQPDNMDTVCATVLFLLKGLPVEQVYVQQRHSYTDVDLDNYTTQPFFRYRGDDLERAVQTATRLFRMAEADPRIIPASGDLTDWLAFFTDPTRIQKKCTSSKLLFIDPYGRFRGCLHGRVLGSVLNTGMDEFLQSQSYLNHLKLQESCRICTHSGS